MQRLIYCIFFLFCLAHLSAQPHQHYIFSRLGNDNGLASDDVRAVQQDRSGYLWIATLNGLQRYDGQRFLTLQHRSNDPKSIPSNKIFGMQIDQKDRLWLHCAENRVGYLNVSDFTFHEVALNFASDLVKRVGAALFIDNNGTPFLLLSGHTILAYNEVADEFSEKNTPFSLPAKWNPKWLYQDKHQNNYWIACDSGLVKYNPASKKISYRGHNQENDEIIKAYTAFTYLSHPYFDNSNRFWIERWEPEGAGPFLYCYDVTRKKITEWDTRLNLTKGQYHEIHNIQEQEDGSIWIVGLNLMAFLSKSSSKFEVIPNNIPDEFTIRYNIIKMLFQDREKNIWACTDKGLYRFNPSAELFKIVGNQRPGRDSVYTPDVTDILQTSNGDILVSTWGNGTFSYDNNFIPINAPHIEPALQQGEGLTWALHQRRNGDIWWVCQGGFIFITSAITKKTIRIRPPVFEEATIRQVIEDKNGNLWLGTHRGHLVKWNATDNTFQLILKSGTVFRLYSDKKGDIWMCTGGDGVYRINPVNGAVIAQYNAKGPEGKRLMGIGAADILQYNDSIYVIASEALNLLNIKTGAIRFFGSENGLPSNAVENIIEDKKGYIWLTTDGHLCRIRPGKFVVSVFNEEDGLPSSSFNQATANMLSDGRIVIGRIHDFIVFDPEKISPNQIILPDPVITGFTLMNSPLLVDSLRKLPNIELSYNQNSISIEFSTLTYLNHFGITYMMENLDKKWIQAGKAKEAIYNYLPPGNYTFMVKAENGEEGVSKITSIKISVRAPFWETWWFYSLLALLATAIFYMIDRERRRRKEALQKVRGEIAGNLYEEINTALNNINVLSEIARIKADKEPEQSKSYITEIHHKSHNMIIAMDDMLWSIDPANDSMAKTVNRIKEFADALQNRYNSVIEVQTGEKVISLKPDMKVRHELMLIYKIALRLLVEEFGAKQTMIHLYYIQSQLQLNIFSAGIRINDNNNQVIKAIQEIKTRAAAIKAILEFQSDEKGTAIIIAVKTA